MEIKPTNEHQYAHLLTQVLGSMSNEQIEQIFSIAQTLHFEAGEFVFRQGEEENSLYIVLSGRLRVLLKNEKGTQVLGDISSGEPVGELALFTKEPRSASVVALRKSVVLQLNEEDYVLLVQQFPAFANSLTKFVIERLRRNSFQQKTDAIPKNIAIINLHPSCDMQAWATQIQEQFGILNTEIRVYDHQSQSIDNQHVVFDEIEKQSGFNFFICDEEHDTWANQCINYCDLVVLGSEFEAEHAVQSIEKRLNLYSNNVLNKKIYLLLLHPENAPLPTKTRRWFEGRKIDLHIHIRNNHPKDFRRFCRIVSHQAVGLVLGGGGAKGFAHVGVAKALMETGIEFDFVGGTSAGALYGVGLTCIDFNMTEAMNQCRSGAKQKVTSNDYHFPFLSLMTGRKMRKYLKELLGDAYLEDIWTNSYCVSTNYSSATVMVHDSGLARLQVEASIAIPGVFPPVVINKNLYVDGGVMDNLPIEAMYQYPVKDVIAVALSGQEEQKVDIEKAPSSWQIFYNKFSKNKYSSLPNMATILVNSMTLNSRQKQETTKSQVAMYLELDLRKYGFLDWSKWEELIEVGYRQTQDYLKEKKQIN
jgi:predicted acylesterase/phospholipase RssA